MRVFFMKKKNWLTWACYLLAGCLLLLGISLISPSSQETVANADAQEPYRCGPIDSDNISLAINVDWGEEYIPDMLRILAEKNVQATFFLTGRWADNNPDLAADIAAAGHELGNHGYSHTSPNASSVAEITEEIQRTETAIKNATGQTTVLYAPPSGESEDHVLSAASELGYDTILWSVDTIDWQKPTAETIIDRVESKIHGGAIILAHPTAPTVEALPQLIDDLKEKGYNFATVSSNLGL